MVIDRAKLSPISRGIQHYFSSSIVEQAFSNYAAMTDAHRHELAARIGKFHEDAQSENPFSGATA